jgi:uncharacterized protein
VSYSVDTNILLHASNAASPWHAAARSFLAQRAGDPDIFCVAWITLMGYVRIATHPRVFPHPLSPKEALANVEALLALPRVRAISEEDRFLDVYREVTGSGAVRGNLVPDAHLAALLRQHGIRRLYTADADFRRFDFLEARNPLVS